MLKKDVLIQSLTLKKFEISLSEHFYFNINPRKYSLAITLNGIPILIHIPFLSHSFPLLSYSRLTLLSHSDCLVIHFELPLARHLVFPLLSEGGE